MFEKRIFVLTRMCSKKELIEFCVWKKNFCLIVTGILCLENGKRIFVSEFVCVCVCVCLNCGLRILVQEFCVWKRTFVL